MELLAGIETRCSIRGFKPTPIPEEILRRLLKIASNSPSYTNTQPWEVAVVTGKKRDELSQIFYQLADAETSPNADLPLPRTWPPELEKRAKEHGARRFKALGIERENAQQRKELRLMNFAFYGAPCVIFLYTDKTLGPWSIFDMGLFAQSLILTAHSFGLGSCLQASVVNYPEAVKKFLGIPESKQLIIGISIGYPDPEAKLNTYRAVKLKPEEFTRWYH